MALDKQKYLERFKDLYEAKNGIRLSDAEALELFEKLVVLVDAIYQPIPKENYGGGKFNRNPTV